MSVCMCVQYQCVCVCVLCVVCTCVCVHSCVVACVHACMYMCLFSVCMCLHLCFSVMCGLINVNVQMHIIYFLLLGSKTNNIQVVYTLYGNLKKTQGMDVGQVGFHSDKEV